MATIGVAIPALVLAGAASTADASVEREDIIVLAADGHHYTSYKTLRSDLAQRVLYLGPHESPGDNLFIVPSTYEATALDNGGTRLRFGGGSYAIMQTGKLSDTRLRKTGDGSWLFTSWRGPKRRDGHFGKWNAPGKFDSFVYSWIVPASIEITGYNANRDGQWRQHGQALSWHGRQVNDIVFKIRYRRAPSPSQPSAQAPAPGQPPPQSAARQTPRGANLVLAPALKAIPLPTDALPTNTAAGARPAPARIRRTRNGLALTHLTVFNKGRPVVTDHGRVILERLAKALQAAQASRIRVTGPDVADARQMGASAARAARVAQYLIDQGIDAEIIRASPGDADKQPQDTAATHIAIEPRRIIATLRLAE